VNSESPAYSRDGDQSAGFYGCGIQRATRLMRAHSNQRSRHNNRPIGDVKRSGKENFPPQARRRKPPPWTGSRVQSL